MAESNVYARTAERVYRALCVRDGMRQDWCNMREFWTKATMMICKEVVAVSGEMQREREAIEAKIKRERAMG